MDQLGAGVKGMAAEEDQHVLLRLVAGDVRNRTAVVLAHDVIQHHQVDVEEQGVAEPEACVAVWLFGVARGDGPKAKKTPR